MLTTQQTAQEFWQDATPRLVRKLYAAAGLTFHEACLFSPVEFALLPAELKVAIYESEEWRTQPWQPTDPENTGDVKLAQELNARDARTMDNLTAYRLGQLVGSVGTMGCSAGVGDEIDRGLIFVRKLGEIGFQLIRKNNQSPALPEDWKRR